MTRKMPTCSHSRGGQSCCRSGTGNNGRINRGCHLSRRRDPRHPSADRQWPRGPNTNRLVQQIGRGTGWWHRNRADSVRRNDHALGAIS